MFDHLLESSHCDDSNKWSNIGFCEEIGIVEIKICTLSGALVSSMCRDDRTDVIQDNVKVKSTPHAIENTCHKKILIHKLFSSI